MLYPINHGINPDARDAEILAKLESAWDRRQGPRVGDFVLIGDRYGRFSHDWGDGLQWSENGSFYLGEGYASFSGGLNKTIPLENLTLTDETRAGDFWFFHHGFAQAHSGVGARIACRVWRAKTAPYLVKYESGETLEVLACDQSDAWGCGVAYARAKREEERGKGAGYDYYPPKMTVTEILNQEGN